MPQLDLGLVKYPIDEKPTDGSANPVSSDGVFEEEKAIKQISAPILSDPAGQAVSAGQYFIYDNVLRKAKQAIGASTTAATFTSSSYSEVVSSGGLNDLKSAITFQGYNGEARTLEYGDSWVTIKTITATKAQPLIALGEVNFRNESAGIYGVSIRKNGTVIGTMQGSKTNNWDIAQVLALDSVVAGDVITLCAWQLITEDIVIYYSLNTNL